MNQMQLTLAKLEEVELMLNRLLIREPRNNEEVN